MPDGFYALREGHFKTHYFNGTKHLLEGWNLRSSRCILLYSDNSGVHERGSVLIIIIKIFIYCFRVLELTLFEVALCGEPSLDRPGILSGEIKGQKRFDSETLVRGKIL